MYSSARRAEQKDKLREFIRPGSLTIDTITRKAAWATAFRPFL